MSDFDKRDEIRRKYGEIMKDISNGLNEINNNNEFNNNLNEINSNDGINNSLDEIRTQNDTLFDDDKIVGNFTNYKPDSDDIDSYKDSNNDIDNYISISSSADYDETSDVSSSRDIENKFDTAPIYNITDSIGDSDEFNHENQDIFDSITCDDCSELLFDYVSDCTYESESNAIEAHLLSCESCRMELDDIRDMIAVLGSAKAPTPPDDLISKIHESLVVASPDVRAEYDANLAAIKQNKKAMKEDSKFIDRVKDLCFTARDRVDYFIRHANWRVIAPVALSAILVVGVSATGLYQVMKTSDEIYDFSDNPSVASSRATSKPSRSGLDGYLEDGDDDDFGSSGSSLPKRTSSPKTTSLPRTTSTPKTASGSVTTPRTTTKPSSGTSSSGNTTGSNGRITSSSSRATATPKPAATSTPKYETPKIILPSIPDITRPDGSSVVIPETPPTQEPKVSPFENNGSGGNTVTGSGGGGGGSNGGGAAVVPTPAPTSSPTQKPADPTDSPAPVATPATTAKPELARNDKGETDLYRKKASNMSKASVVSCVIDKQDVFDALMNSALVNCSKIDESGEIIIYLTSDEYTTFAKFVKDNDVAYKLVSLGDNNDVKIVLDAPDLILSTPVPTAVK